MIHVRVFDGAQQPHAELLRFAARGHGIADRIAQMQIHREGQAGFAAQKDGALTAGAGYLGLLTGDMYAGDVGAQGNGQAVHRRLRRQMGGDLGLGGAVFVHRHFDGHLFGLHSRRRGAERQGENAGADNQQPKQPLHGGLSFHKILKQVYFSIA